MPDNETTPNNPDQWHHALRPCPRCSTPLFAQATKRFSRITILRCRKCAWTMDVESIRTALKSAHAPMVIEEEPYPDAQE